MKKLLIAIALSLSLAACGTMGDGFQKVETTLQNTFTSDNYDTVTALYGSTLTALVTYRRLCIKKLVDVNCKANIVALQPYEAKAYNAYTTLRDFIKQNPTMDATALISLTKTVLISLANKQAELGVK